MTDEARFTAWRDAIARIDPRPPLALLLVATLAPLAGVLWLGWAPASLIGFFWLENVLLGVFHVAKMLAARGTPYDPRLERALAAAALTPEQRAAQLATAYRVQHFVMPGVFVLHYGAFCVAHGLVIAFVFDGAFADFDTALGALAIATMAAQFAHSAWRFRRDPPLVALPRTLLMFQPYARVVVLHLALLLGALPMLAGYPLVSALVLAAIKLIADTTQLFSLRRVFADAMAKHLHARSPA